METRGPEFGGMKQVESSEQLPSCGRPAVSCRGQAACSKVSLCQEDDVDSKVPICVTCGTSMLSGSRLPHF